MRKHTIVTRFLAMALAVVMLLSCLPGCFRTASITSTTKSANSTVKFRFSGEMLRTSKSVIPSVVEGSTH